MYKNEKLLIALENLKTKHNITIKKRDDLYNDDLLSFCLSNKYMSFDEYYELSEPYKYQNVYEMSPRAFEETWIDSHLKQISSKFIKPRNTIDYDYLVDNVKVEVKSSRMVEKCKKETNKKFSSKAVLSTTTVKYDMNFQQIKPTCCDVFLLIVVSLDKIKYFILTSQDIKNNKRYCNKQHGHGHKEVEEGQLLLTQKSIIEFSKYEVDKDKIISKILEL